MGCESGFEGVKNKTKLMTVGAQPVPVHPFVLSPLSRQITQARRSLVLEMGIGKRASDCSTVAVRAAAKQ